MRASLVKCKNSIYGILITTEFMLTDKIMSINPTSQWHGFHPCLLIRDSRFKNCISFNLPDEVSSLMAYVGDRSKDDLISFNFNTRPEFTASAGLLKEILKQNLYDESLVHSSVFSVKKPSWLSDGMSLSDFREFQKAGNITSSQMTEMELIFPLLGFEDGESDETFRLI